MFKKPSHLWHFVEGHQDSKVYYSTEIQDELPHQSYDTMTITQIAMR